MDLPGDWAEDALCAETWPDAFFPRRDEWAQLHAARRVCAACPVAVQCFEFAMRTDQMHGVWGGTSAIERKRLRAKRRAA
jgi:WhiB family redox-sensing transcriptional regulator